MKSRVQSLAFVSALFLAICSPAFGQTISKLESASGWSGCSSCAQGATTSTYSMTQFQSSPSLDGSSTRFSIGGSSPWGLALWHKFLGYHDSANNATLDFWLYGTGNEKSNGMEFALSQAVNGKWYKWSVQFSYLKKVMSVWDSANHCWVATSLPVSVPSNYTWHHYIFTFNKANGKAGFLTATIDGQTTYINKFFNPASTSNHGVSTHFQLNQNSSADDYAVWLNKVTVLLQ